MRRFLLLLLMCVLSLQTTWAAASSICRHEAAAQAAHFGHHVHAHEGTDAQADPATDNAAAEPAGDTVDGDCSHCQLGANALATATPDIRRAALPDAGATPYRRSVTQGLPERLTRPPHLFLV